MIEGLTLDQIRVLLAVAEAGSFSAAARRVGRAQSAVSYAVAALEAQLGVALFDRGGWRPVLTPAGRAIVEDARAVAAGIDGLRARAKGLAGGLEPELGLAVEVMFPLDVLTRTVAAFGTAFPTVPLRLHVEALGAVAAPVLERRCAVGIMGPLPIAPEALVRAHLLDVPLVAVAAADHPLARQPGPLDAGVLGPQAQLVLTDRSTLTEGRDYGVFSTRTWRLADLGAKHAFLRAGLGWGLMPEAMVRDDLARGSLVRLDLAEGVPGPLAMLAIHRRDAPPGPAGRWLVERLRAEGLSPPAR